MKEEPISRAHLETLSFSDLVQLADEYGVDVPQDLDRRFLIEELFELAEESNTSEEEMIIAGEETPENPSIFTGNYNETQVSGILCNPTWLFVFWNISDADSLKLKDLEEDYSLQLRICSLKDPKDPVPEEAFEVQISGDSQEQYVLLPSGKKYIKVELVYVTASSGKVLAFSPVIVIPQGNPMLNDLQMGKNKDFSPVIELSGINEIITDHYKNHRHSF